MKQLKDRICSDGIIRNEKILDVSSFFNTRIDPMLMQALGKDFSTAFREISFDFYVTVESSGIAPTLCASIASQKPMVIIKKELTETSSDHVMQIPCYSYTKNHTFYLSVNRDYLMGKSVILIDDFLADGNVLNATLTLLENSGARCAGIGICIAKTFQKGYAKAHQLGIPFHCQAKIKSLNPLIIE